MSELVAGAAYMLGRVGVVDSGEGAFWESMIAKSAEGMGGESLLTGRKWIPGPESTFEGEPDARYAGKERI